MWKRELLEEACTLISRGISPKYTEEGGVLVINQKCVRNHTIDYSLARRHDIEKKNVKPERFIQRGDILINSTGQGTLGRVAQVRDEPPEPTTVDSHVTIVRPNPEKFYLDYFGYALIQIEDELKNSGQGTSGQTELAKTRVQKEFFASYPSDKSEQQRIVAKLDAAFAEIDRAIERVNQQLLESKALYKTSLTRCFNDDSVPRKPLSEICKITSSKRVMKKDYVDNGVPFYRTKEIKQLANGEPVTTELFISKEMFDSLRHKYGAPKEGEILITAIGTIGEVYILREDDEFYFKDGNVLWLKEILEVSQEYLRYGLLSFVEQLNSLAHGAAYSALPIQRLKAFELPIPPIHQQLEIVKRLEESFELITTYKNSLSSKRKSLDILKSAILSQELQPPQSEAA